VTTVLYDAVPLFKADQETEKGLREALEWGVFHPKGLTGQGMGSWKEQ